MTLESVRINNWRHELIVYPHKKWVDVTLSAANSSAEKKSWSKGNKQESENAEEGWGWLQKRLSGL